MANSTKRCKQCKEWHPAAEGVQTPGGWFHVFACAITHANLKVGRQRVAAKKKKEKEARSEHRKAKERIKTRGEWTKQAQTAFNRYIRSRDSSLPCISCLRHHSGQYHAGHYRTVGAHPELRFDESNCHKQCAPCNNHKSGNIVEYRINLLGRIGADLLDTLEGPHPAAKLSIDDIRAIEAEYKQKLKELQND